MRSRWTISSRPTARSPTGIATRNLKRRRNAGGVDGLWEANWKLVFDALAPLTEADLSARCRFGGEAHSVLQAINRQMGHYAYHVGQIVYLAKHFADEWKDTLRARPQISGI